MDTKAYNRRAQLEALCKMHGTRIALHGETTIDVEVRTVGASLASIAVSLVKRRIVTYNFAPNGFTVGQLLLTTAAMAQLLGLALSVWDLYEVQP